METGQTIPNSFFESFWGQPAEEEPLKPEDRDFYVNFLEKNDKLDVEIISYDFLEEYSKKYTVYNIRVITDYFSYTIQKRFSLFLQLRNQLKDEYFELNLNQITFPPKTYFSFGGTDIDTIEKRRSMLNEFILLLASKCKKYYIIEFLKFLEIKGRTELALNNQTSYPFTENTFTTNIQEVTKLLQYLDYLNRNPDDSSKILREMEACYIAARPRLTPDVVRFLLVGRPKSKGLIHFCGKFDPETSLHLVCAVGLEFLATLLDYQKCPDAEQFNAAYGSLDLKTIGLLNLSDHTDGQVKASCKSCALKLTDIFLCRNPKLTPNDILKKASSLQEYNLWKKKNKTSSIVAERYEVNSKLNEIKEITEYSFSPPQSSSVNSLDEFSSNADKLFPVGKLDWSELYKDSEIKIKYCRSKYLSITLKSTKDLNACAAKLTQGIDYRILCEEGKIVKELDIDTSILQIKIKFDFPPYKYLTFVSERRVEESLNDRIAILERPCRNYPVMLSGSELMVKRFANIVIGEDCKTKGKQTKLKMLVKNLDEGSRALQDYLLKEEGGRLLLESCKKFLADVENERN